MNLQMEKKFIKAHAGESLEIEALKIILWFSDTTDTAPEWKNRFHRSMIYRMNQIPITTVFTKKGKRPKFALGPKLLPPAEEKAVQLWLSVEQTKVRVVLGHGRFPSFLSLLIHIQGLREFSQNKPLQFV